MCVTNPWAHMSLVHSILSLKLGVTLSKLCLGLEYNMKTNPIYTYSGCPKNVDNSKQIRL